MGCRTGCLGMALLAAVLIGINGVRFSPAFSQPCRTAFVPRVAGGWTLLGAAAGGLRSGRRRRNRRRKESREIPEFSPDGRRVQPLRRLPPLALLHGGRAPPVGRQ